MPSEQAVEKAEMRALVVDDFSTMRSIPRLTLKQRKFEVLPRALDAGANEYIMKPFTSDVVTSKLDLLGF